MNIYPYVYKLIHKSTKQFYIGVRWANKVPAEMDLGYHYFSSSKVVESIGFDNFESHIIAIFFDSDSARKYESLIIEENWNDPLILNKTLAYEKFICPSLSPTAREKIRQANLRRGGHSAETKARIGDAIRGVPRKPFTQETKDRMSKALKGIPKSDEHCANLSAAAKGSTKKPQSEEHKAKIREAVKLSWAKRKSLI